MMSEINNSDTSELAKPAKNDDDDLFPPFPDPDNNDFEEDICEAERDMYKSKFSDLNSVKTHRVHCTACDKHLGCSPRNESRMRTHPLLRTLVCQTCHTFYNSGEFDKGEDGSELYCRWCGQGGQVYCCSNCPHVFCAKCIKRNLGPSKIKEIENTDDWKCFKCNTKCLWELRALCWALLRYCDIRNKLVYTTQDQDLKVKYQKACAVDDSVCCRHKRKSLKETKKRESVSSENKDEVPASIVSKLPPTIQVKKFASINIEEPAKKAMKRPASPKNKQILIKNPITIATCPKIIPVPSLPKRMRLPISPINSIRFSNDRKPAVNCYGKIRPRYPQNQPMQIISSGQYNGFSNAVFQNMPANDNINLSLESLTQGLDMASVAAMANSSLNQDDDVVCTPDFPLEPLCEVTEDNTDDDVQCITPSTSAAPKGNSAAPKGNSAAPKGNNAGNQPTVPRTNQLPEMFSENIIQMTENDVTVNSVTGGLKFRVDPQTLSSNKMYRLPDGRIFAINANPNMPGGYSATIVALTESGKNSKAGAPKGTTYAAKLNAIPVTSSTPPPLKFHKKQGTANSKKNPSKNKKQSKKSSESKGKRQCDLRVPVEWYRFNLVDACDALDYSMSRLCTLRKEVTTAHLRTRTVDEMRDLHRTLDRVLYTTTTRFKEIADNLNKGFKQYMTRKMGIPDECSIDEDDDDVEILPDIDEDPIYIDENSMESNSNDITTVDTQEVDLTGVGSSEHNDSGDKSFDNTVVSTESHDPLERNKEDNSNKCGNSSNTSCDEENDENDSKVQEKSDTIIEKRKSTDKENLGSESKKEERDETPLLNEKCNSTSDTFEASNSKNNKDDEVLQNDDESARHRNISNENDDNNKNDRNVTNENDDNNKNDRNVSNENDNTIKNDRNGSNEDNDINKNDRNGSNESITDTHNGNDIPVSCDKLNEIKTDKNEEDKKIIDSEITEENKNIDSEMSDEMIESLLKCDDGEESLTDNCVDITEIA